jgi:hypothetical protein
MNGPRHRVIYTHGGGRLGNQLLRFLHWVAWVRTVSDVEILNLAFWPYAPYFRVWREHPGCVFPLRSSKSDVLARALARSSRLRNTWEGKRRVQRAVQSVGHWFPGWQAIDRDATRDEAINLVDPEVLAKVRSRRVTTCCGWRIAHWAAVEEYSAELRELFAPAPELEEAARAFIAPLRQDYDLVVGVLIRQSDYREWHGGRFLFSGKQYAEWLRQLVALETGRRVAFVIAGEESQEPACFAGLSCYFASGSVNAGGHWFASWAELAHCDLILSPPSTFAATAAFRGGIPLWPLVSGEQRLDPQQLIRDGLAGAARHSAFSLAVK